MTYSIIARERLGNHVATKAPSTIEGPPLLGNGPVNISRGNEYGTIRQKATEREVSNLRQ
jgi:hypothetical protein